jgi:hypothetical protein
MSDDKDFSITVGFSTTNKFMSRVIRWATGGRVSHAWISFYDKCLGTRFVLQAETWGYELRTWSRWNAENILVAEFKPVGDLSGAMLWSLKSLGLRYDWTSAFFAGIRRWLGRWVRGKFSSPGRLMCAEAVIRFLSHGGVGAVSSLDPETTSPARLLRVVSESDEFMDARV